MRVLLIAMPDTISALDPVIRVPNLGLCSLAANVSDCDVKVLDLAFHSKGVTHFLADVLSDYRPDVVGLSAMSFQFASACRAASICRQHIPAAKIVLGGYHATLMYEGIGGGPSATLFDFLVRGEGELTFRALVEQLTVQDLEFSKIDGLSFRTESGFRHNPPRALANLDTLRLPDRSARLLDRAAFMGAPFDCAETSRGCTMDCHFCSITHMYGRCIRSFKLERVIADLRNLKESGKRGVFFVDDNITLDVQRLKRLCALIAVEKLDDTYYVMQASVAGIASDDALPPLLKAAGFKWVFLGIENGIRRNLEAMGKAGSVEATRRAVSSLRDQGIGVFGGFITGNPEDTAEDIRATFKLALDLGVDHPIMQYLTPYPMTRTRDELTQKGLISNMEDFSLYNGFTANAHTASLTPKQLNQAVFWNGLRLYFNPRYLMRSRFWRYSPRFWPALMANNVRYLAGARRGRIFPSRHRW